MSEVKRYDVSACIDTPAKKWHSVVLASDYDFLATRCKAALDAAVVAAESYRGYPTEASARIEKIRDAWLAAAPGDEHE